MKNNIEINREVDEYVMSLSSDPDSNPDVHSTSRVVQGWIDRLPTDEVYEIWDRDNSLTCVVVNGIAEVAKAIPGIIPGLIEQLVENSRVRRQLAWAVGLIGRERKEAVDSLIALLGHENLGVQIAVIDALGNAGTRALDAVPLLIRFLQKYASDWELCFIAIPALAEIGSGSETAYVTIMKLAKEGGARPFYSHFVAVLSHMSTWGGETVALWLADSLHNPDEAERVIAAKAIAGSLGSEKFVPQLISALDDSNHFVRRLACSGMANIANKERTDLVGIFQWALYDDDHDVRCQALRGLTEIGPAANEALREVTKALDDSDEYNRERAAECLRKITL